MTLENFSYLAEIIGVLLVIASLIYVAKQLRQNTDAVLAQSRHAVLTASQAELYSYVENPDLTVSLANLDPLTPEQHAKISSSLFATFRARQFAWLQYRDGNIDEAQWQTEVSVIKFFLDQDRVRVWWSKLGRVAFGDEYSNFIDSLIADLPATNSTFQTSTTWSLS